MSTYSTDLRYPIGQYQPHPYSDSRKQEWLNDIKFLPQLLENAIENLDEAQLLTPYRDGGWTVQQVVHHVADSHINAMCRFKLGLTENHPTIRPYDEAAWAKLIDVQTIPVNVSITLLYALHTRLHAVVSDITMDQWERTVHHPEAGKDMTLWYLLGNYAWHGKHHTAHIMSLRERNKW
ncbi:MAG TPA: putative metal-dependent hydrolase [Puia sp.]